MERKKQLKYHIQALRFYFDVESGLVDRLTGSMIHSSTMRELKLHSPVGVEPAVFTWPSIDQQKIKKDAVFLGGDEIVRTIRLVFEDYPVLYQQNLGLDNCDIHSFSKMKELCDKFNKIIDTHVKLNRGTEAFSARLQQRPTPKLFRHILAQVYSRAVTNPEKLREYEPFSPSVYGETSPDLIDSILTHIHLTEDQTFIDLGSGVGNVVLHVAALCNCKFVYGIEHEETPAKYAYAMADEFRFWMRWYGKYYSEFQLEKGDFLTHPSIDERIKEADVVFANNYVFGSTVNHELKVKFMNMKDGAKIISSREFCPETFRLNDRTKNDLGAVMHVSKPDEFLGKVSWSDKCVQYYLHVIDHSKLAHYYEKTHQNHIKGSKPIRSKHSDDDHHSSSSSSNTVPILSSGGLKPSHVTKIDENQPPSHDSHHNKRKRTTTMPSTSSNTSTILSQRGRKIRVKRHSDNESDVDSDTSNDDVCYSKHRRSSYEEYQLTINELHNAAKRFVEENQRSRIENERFNYQKMTKLTNDNLHLRHLHNSIIEQDGHDFLNSINSYLEQFRQRLVSHFMYMKSDGYREHLKKQLNNEMELNKTLKMKVNSLENNIKALLEDAIHLLKLRTNELGIEELEQPVQLLSYANDISTKHKELRVKVVALEKEIAEYNNENDRINIILNNIQTTGHPSSSSSESMSNENVYSKLLVNMSRQTQQHENKQQFTNIDYLNRSLNKKNQSSCSPISPNTTMIEKDSDMNIILSNNSVKCERKTDFIIQKRSKKLSNTVTSPAKVASTTPVEQKYDSSEHLPHSSHSPIPHNSVLLTKQIEPVQVHSVISKTANLAVQDKDMTPVPSNKSDDNSQDMITKSPRKKRDFYGKSSDSSSTDKDRPSSTPACTQELSTTTLPDRPISIPPLRASSYI